MAVGAMVCSSSTTSPRRCSRTRRMPEPRATSPDGSADARAVHCVGVDMRTRKQTVIALERELAREIARAARGEADGERLAHVLDAFEDGVVVVDETGTEIRRNPAA